MLVLENISRKERQLLTINYRPSMLEFLGMKFKNRDIEVIGKSQVVISASNDGAPFSLP